MENKLKALTFSLGLACLFLSANSLAQEVIVSPLLTQEQMNDPYYGNSRVVNVDGGQDHKISPKYSLPGYPDAYLNSTLPANYTITPYYSTTATDVLTWKNPYFQAVYGYTGYITCLQVIVDNAAPTRIDCENTGNNNYRTTISWVQGGHVYNFYLATYQVQPTSNVGLRDLSYAVARFDLNTH